MIYMIIQLNKDFLNNFENNKVNNLVIGYFDGLHKGHQKLFDELVGDTSVLTFENVPKKVGLLYDANERIRQLFSHFSINDVYVFDVAQNNMTAIEFINSYLKKINPKLIIVGEDFKFGSDQKDVNFLKDFFSVKVVARNDDYSSSNIKKMLANSEFDLANKELLENYYRSGVVVHNLKISRNLGFPTANIEYDEKFLKLQDGIYITKSIVKNKIYLSTSFIGIPKTFENITKPSFESYLIDYDGPEFYGEKIKIEFYKRIADVKKYDSIDELKKGIENQVQQTIEYFSNLNK